MRSVGEIMLLRLTMKVRIHVDVFGQTSQTFVEAQVFGCLDAELLELIG